MKKFQNFLAIIAAIAILSGIAVCMPCPYTDIIMNVYLDDAYNTVIETSNWQYVLLANDFSVYGDITEMIGSEIKVEEVCIVDETFVKAVVTPV